MSRASSRPQAPAVARLRKALHVVGRPWSLALASLDPRWFYIGLSVVLGSWVVGSDLLRPEAHREASTYDWMLAHRFREPVPDPEIVVLDIDERSLAAMAADYGRWPWPRDTLATVLAGLQAQGAAAVVFDILFTDADTRDPVSERAFDDAVKASGIGYYPVLRLPAVNDAKSALHAVDVHGLVVSRQPTEGHGLVVSRQTTEGYGPAIVDGSGPTIAVVLPYLDGMVRSGRLGTINVDPDADGLVRRYRIHEDVGALRIVSLPLRLALDFGWPVPTDSDQALRFNGHAMAYRTTSFADLFADLLKQRRTRPADEFRGKIVVVGATAPGLADLKGTPVSRAHPGVDLLATAIDDIKNDRFVDELGEATDIAIALVLLASMAWLCMRYSHEQLRLAFVIAPGLLFGISYLTLNLSRVFVDLATPASMAFVYFSAAKLYSAQVRKRWSEGELFAPLLEPSREQWVGCLAAALDPDRRTTGFETRYLNLLRIAAPHVRVTSGLDEQSWLGGAFRGVVVATWVEAAGDVAAIARARDEATRLVAGLRSIASTAPTRAPLPTRFLEETIAAERDDLTTTGSVADPAVPRRLDRLRSLVARTVLHLSQGARP